MSGPRHQAAVPVFDQVRASIAPGDHVVGRYPGVLIVCLLYTSDAADE